ncbi:MAG: two-component regulator propeller domain-containing protein, partial [Luteimonas sp.]
MRFSVFVALARIRGVRACASTLLAVLVASTAFHATAAVREYYFERAGGEHGLAQNTVTALAQDADGFIWVGTQGGLHRFDGQQYLLYRQDVRDPGSLPDSFITALAPDAHGGLWIGTYSHDVARLDLASGRIIRYGDRQPGSDRIRQVTALLPTPDGIWIATKDGLDRLDPATGRRTHILTLPADTPLGQSQALLRDQQGTVWYATAAGLYRLDRNGTVPALRIDSAGPLHALLRDRSGRIWVGGSGGLFLLSDRKSLLRAWPHGDDTGGDVRALAQAPDDHLWMSITEAGLRRFDPGSGTTQSLRQDVALPASLPEDAINALLVDSGGLLWVGGQLRGVSVADSRGARFPYLVDLKQGSNPGLDNLHGGARANSIRAIISTHDQRLWLASDDGRLLRYAADSGFEDFSSLLKPPAGHQGPWRVMAFADPGDGMPWVATTTGLFRLDPQVPSLRAVAIPGIEA